MNKYSKKEIEAFVKQGKRYIKDNYPLDYYRQNARNFLNSKGLKGKDRRLVGHRLYRGSTYLNNKKDIVYILKTRLVAYLYQDLKERGIEVEKPFNIEKILCFTILQFKEYIEKLFIEGIDWSNIDEWHLDHIVPVSKFKYKSIGDKEFKRCWGLSNFQPLKGFKNISKSNDITIKGQELLNKWGQA